MNKNINRTEQTKYDIKHAFIRLMEQKKAEDITIREVSETSGYHRSTIYLYFKNVSDILNQIENDILDDFHNSLSLGLEKNPPKDVDEFVRIVVSVFRKQSHMSSRPLFVLLGENGDISFYNTVKEHFKSHVRELDRFYELTDDDERDYIVEFISSGIVSVIKRWFERGMDISAEELVGYMAKYILAVFERR